MSQLFSKELYQQAEDLFSKYPRKVNALLPLLHMVQKERGHICAQSMEEVAKMCEVAVTHVQGVVTFYTMYAQSPQGKRKISVCTNIACYIRGAMDVLHHLEKELSVSPGHSTENGEYYLEEVEGLGACGYAPVLLVDEKYYENVDKDKINQIIERRFFGKC